MLLCRDGSAVGAWSAALLIVAERRHQTPGSGGCAGPGRWCKVLDPPKSAAAWVEPGTTLSRTSARGGSGAVDHRHPGAAGSVRTVADPPFVPTDFDPPTALVSDHFRLEPLGPQHNEADHAAWTSSIAHVRSTPGFSDGSWPPPEGMSLDRYQRSDLGAAVSDRYRDADLFAPDEAPATWLSALRPPHYLAALRRGAALPRPGYRPGGTDLLRGSCEPGETSVRRSRWFGSSLLLRLLGELVVERPGELSRPASRSRA